MVFVICSFMFLIMFVIKQTTRTNIVFLTVLSLLLEAQIFFSFRDIFIFHNRLKYHLSELVVEWLEQMRLHGFVLNNLDHKLIAIDDNIVSLENLPEIDDMVNGNIKIHWTYQP